MLHIAQAIERHIKNSDVVVRLLYAVGNCAASYGKCHVKFLKTTRRVLTHYSKRVMTNKEHSKTDRDVILKAIRVCANFALEEAGANAIIAENALIQIHITLFKLILDEKSHVPDKEEFLKYILASLNNIIYFSSSDFEVFARDIAALFIKVLMGSNLVIISESCRALGNLSRYECVREEFMSQKADLILIALLDSPDVNIVQHVVGILINFSLKINCAHLFIGDNNEGLRKVLSAMTDFGDWQLATLIVQLLWNILRHDKQIISGDRRNIILQSINAVSSVFPQPNDTTEAHEQRNFSEICERFQEQIVRI